MSAPAKNNSLGAARFIMVLSSTAPLLVIWAVRGAGIIPDRYFISGCAALVVLPNVILWWRIAVAKKSNDARELALGKCEDHRDHLFVYLFAMLMPFYTSNLSTWREFGAAIAALLLILFLFWHLDLHYMNVVWALMGYRVFTVLPATDGNSLSGTESFVLLSPRIEFKPNDRIIAYRVSDGLWLEKRQ